MIRDWNAPLFEGTPDDIARADHSPAHLWPEARNPANQWLANLKGRKRLAIEVHNAGVAARLQVRQEFRAAGYPVPPERGLP